MEPSAAWVVFEQPLVERVRSFLRLEFLFEEYAHFVRDDSHWGVRAAVHTLLDILSILARSDPRAELIKDFSEQQAALARLVARPGVDRTRLDSVLQELHAAIQSLTAPARPAPAQFLRENEFLFAVHNRSAIPGGTCGFDLPAYHRWLSRPIADTRRDLSAWFAPLHSYRQAIALSLRLLRERSEVTSQVAESGVYLHVTQAAYALVRVFVPRAADVYPEISAGKHRVSIRFMHLGDVNTRNVQTPERLEFRLQCCSLAVPA